MIRYTYVYTACLVRIEYIQNCLTSNWASRGVWVNLTRNMHLKRQVSYNSRRHIAFRTLRRYLEVFESTLYLGHVVLFLYCCLAVITALGAGYSRHPPKQCKATRRVHVRGCRERLKIQK